MNLEELKKQQRWLVWESEEGRKVPRYANGKSRTLQNKENEFTDSSMLVDYDQAIATGKNVGFVTGDGISCIDIDHAIENEIIHPVAQEIIDSCQSYTELSPSGTGAHIICTGDLPIKGNGCIYDGHENLKAESGLSFDLFDSNQFVTFTGNHVGGSPSKISPVISSVASKFSKKSKEKAPVDALPIESLREKISEEKWQNLVKRGSDALDKACWSIQCEQKGNRKDQINAQAYYLAGWVKVGALSRKKAYKELYEAAKGMEDPLPDNEIKRNIESGIQDGPALTLEFLLNDDTTSAKLHQTPFINIGDPNLELNLNANWLIKGFLPAVGVTSIFADSYTGKTYTALSIAFATTTGSDWCGYRVKNPGDVIYVAGEDDWGVRNRAKAYTQFHNITEVSRLLMMPSPVAIPDVKSVKEFIEKIRREEANPKLIIVDTLATCFDGGSKNNDQDMNRFLDGCRNLKNAFDCCVLFIDHTGHDNKSRASGSHVRYAALDAEYRLQKKNGGLITLTRTKLKNDTLGKPFEAMLRFESVELGHDEDGDPVVQSVVVSLDDGAMLDFADLVDEKKIIIKGSTQKRAISIVDDNITMAEADLRKALRESGISQANAHNVVSKLIDDGALNVSDDRTLEVADNVEWK